jgi:transketolase
MNQDKIKKLEKIARDLRIQVIRMMEAAGSGHAGGSMSVAEIVSVLYFDEMKINPRDPADPDRDRFVLSKGHACFTVYAALARVGFLAEEQLYHPYEVDSPIQGHPELGICPGIDMGTGALGQGLSAGIGMALAARIQKRDFRVYVVIGDGEANEGMVWEASMLAPKYSLDNLVAILDYNKIALTGPIAETVPLEPVSDKWKSFGWNVLEVDGHSVAELLHALVLAREVKGKPTMIIAHTVKGKGMSLIEGARDSHALAKFTSADAEKAVSELMHNE